MRLFSKLRNIHTSTPVRNTTARLGVDVINGRVKIIPDNDEIHNAPTTPSTSTTTTTTTTPAVPVVPQSKYYAVFKPVSKKELSANSLVMKESEDKQCSPWG